METRMLAFEIGTEEIPAFDLSNAVKQLRTLVPKLLDEAAIPHGDVEIYCSPRRLIVLAHNLPEATEAKSEILRVLRQRLLLMKTENLLRLLLGLPVERALIQAIW